MLIDCSYFMEGPRHIQNATCGKGNLKPLPVLTGTLPMDNSVAVNKTIEAYIAEFQEEFLKGMLGETVGNKAHTYLVTLDEDGTPSQNPTYDAVLERLKVPFADYVFFHILRDANTQSTVTGLVRLKCANEYVAPIRRQVTVWNSMVDRNRLFASWAKTSECPLRGIEVDTCLLTKINPFNL